MRTLFGILLLLTLGTLLTKAPAAGINPDGTGTFSFVFWNVENLFDDKDDNRREVDEEYDNGFAKDAKLRQEKLDHLATALLKMNDGIGPDIIACAEVESVRAADLLKATLNKHLDDAKADPKLKYTQVVMKNLDAGRHIAPCIITRLNVSHAYTKLHGRDLRILEGRIVVNGHELVIIASHWTSQLKQDNGGNGEKGRNKYADTIWDVYAPLMKKNPKTDFLVCGDFNDSPEAAAIVEGLNTTSDITKVVPTANDPKMLNLMAGKPADKFNTIVFSGKPLIYDHICVSPGMLDKEGWSVEPASIKSVSDGLTRTARRDPWRFGNPGSAPVGGRGYSDHFPVSVTLKLAAPAAKK
jgi:endonuclease/exonuclease/phosphatase family metal-dependent hydrolase